VRRSNSGWAAACDGTVREHAVLARAIREVIAGDEQVTSLAGGNSDELDRWARETARHILGDAEAELP
jgi:hypothetical protein